MSWSSALFIIATIVPAFIQTSLSYAAKLPKEYPLLIPSFWDVILGILGISSLAALGAALSFLAVSVFFLSDIQAVLSGAEVLIMPRNAALLVFATFAAVGGLVVMVFFLAVLGKRFNRRNIADANRKESIKGKRLSDFEF
jgi:hypothetical protein